MNTSSTPNPHLAQQTVARIRAGLDSGKMPVVPQILELIRAISAKVDSISIQDLADVIGQDPGTMARVIAIANKLAYNPGGTEIATVHQAISVVGFERIRNLAVSVMLAENAESAMSIEENREVAGLALASGFLARELLLDSGLIDPEVAFVCAALRNYGRLMLTTFLLEDYERARVLTPSRGADRAFREVFGLTPLELGRELLEGEQLPDVIIESMRQVPVEEVRKQTLSPLEQLASTSEFSVRLFELFENPKLARGNFNTQAARLAEQCVPNLKLGPKTILKHLEEVSLRCQELISTAKANGFQPPLFRRLEALVEDRPLPEVSILSRRIQTLAAHLPDPPPAAAPSPPPPIPAPPAPFPSSPTSPEEPAAAEIPPSAAEALKMGGEKLTQLLQQKQRNLKDIFKVLLDILHHHLHLQQSIVFLLKPGIAGCVARFGRGPIFQTIKDQTVGHSGQREIFSLCLQRGEDIILQNPEDPKVQAFLPPWLQTAARGKCVILLALRDRVGVYGIVLGITADREAYAWLEHFRSELMSLRTILSKIGPSLR